MSKRYVTWVTYLEKELKIKKDKSSDTHVVERLK